MPRHDITNVEGLVFATRRQLQWTWNYAQGPAIQQARHVLWRVTHRIGVNLQPRRLLSFPHVMVIFWIIILMWGERWIFDTKVDKCDWSHWEDWPKDAHPHRLIFVADPQIIDPHSYPGRPWPLSSLTTVVTDNYLLRSYRALQTHLSPDSVFFLGDLFDGGREWKTERGLFEDPELGRGRSNEERRWVKTWHSKYGEDFWLREYERFGNIFFDHFNDGGESPGKYQRGRKLVASLPGNHDLGFGAQVQLSVRDRFEAFFGDVNRVDIVGNHSIVSVDTVSLSADTSEYKERYDLTSIYGPVNEFLDGVQAAKHKAVQEELSIWHGSSKESSRFGHRVEEMEKSKLDRFLITDPGQGAPELPTILLSHVPLYRARGTPCGPLREHWPPEKPPKGQTRPVNPDERNAISISAGYQYQNVLSRDDSEKLISKVGNVVHVFSGDDHDYCEIVHPASQGGAREITVKSLSMAMGVPTPGFVMASLYNPVDERGNPIPGSPEKTLQTHLCLLPNQLHTYMKYIGFIIFSLVVLAVRAMLVPVLNLTPFALDPSELSGAGAGPSLLPVTTSYKDKLEPPEMRSNGPHNMSMSSAWGPRARSSSLTTTAANGRWQPSSKRGPGGRQRLGGFGGAGGGPGGGDGGGGWNGGPRINLDGSYYDSSKYKPDGKRMLGVVGREMWTTTWRVAWMSVLFLVHLSRER